MARRYELSLDEARERTMPRYLVAEADHVQELESAHALIKRHEEKLAMCYRAAVGLSTPDDPDWSLAQDAVKEVKKLRFDYDNLSRAYEEVKQAYTVLRERIEKLDAVVIVD